MMLKTIQYPLAAAELMIALSPVASAKDVALIQADANSVTVTEMSMATDAAVTVSPEGTIKASPSAVTTPTLSTSSVITPVVTQPVQTTTYVEQTPLTIYTQDEMGQPMIESGVLSTATTVTTPAITVDPINVYQSSYLGQPDYYWSGQRWVYLPAN